MGSCLKRFGSNMILYMLRDMAKGNSTKRRIDQIGWYYKYFDQNEIIYQIL